MTPDQQARERLAREADEGYPWKARHSRAESEVILDDGIKFGRCVVAEVASTKTDEDNHVALSQHIAANSPSVILADLARLRALEDEVARLRTDMLEVAYAVGVYRACEGQGDEPGPIADILRCIRECVAAKLREADAAALHAQDTEVGR